MKVLRIASIGIEVGISVTLILAILLTFALIHILVLVFMVGFENKPVCKFITRDGGDLRMNSVC